jgi:hypothetical protein
VLGKGELVVGWKKRRRSRGWFKIEEVVFGPKERIGVVVVVVGGRW